MKFCLSLCLLFFLATTCALATTESGKSAYKKANCVGCHKWHGDGGGGYGGLALSLRKTQLDTASLREVIRCGRPGSRMPYHHRKAYKGDDRSCYETTRSEFGDALPPRAARFLRDTEIDEVVEYIKTTIQGKGAPDFNDCVAFWGDDARQCTLYKAREEKKIHSKN